MKRKILVVEDERAIADTISYALSTEGFTPHWCETAQDALQTLDSSYAAAILDVGLPDMTGFDLFREIQKRVTLPVIFLTARGEEIDRILGLELGADDYVTKPFSPRELCARVRSVLRRSKTLEDTWSAAKSSPFDIDDSRMRISYFGTVLSLSRYEYRLLKVLAERPGRVLTRDQLMTLVWDVPESSLERTVDAHIKMLRAKLREVKPEVDPIETHRGVGYSIKERL